MTLAPLPLGSPAKRTARTARITLLEEARHDPDRCDSARLADLVAGLAAVAAQRLGIGFRQAVLYVPLKLVYRVDDRAMRGAAIGARPRHLRHLAPVARRSGADAVAAAGTDAAHTRRGSPRKSAWLEPWRELARTITFNAEHLFVSRRLVRLLKGNGRLAVYMPDEVEPDVKAFRLFRAVARIAVQGGCEDRAGVRRRLAPPALLACHADGRRREAGSRNSPSRRWSR